MHYQKGELIKMMKMKRIVAWILCFCILAVFTACGAKQTLREDVKRAYNIDEEGEKSISDMFKAFDAEFEKLRESDVITDSDLYQYAESISSIYSSFYDAFDEKYAVVLNNFEEEEKEMVTDIMIADADISMSALRVSDSLLKYLTNDNSGESAFESAVTLVNKCSEFFYGTERFSDEDLDRLAEKFK